jgi:hypothetical protein
MVELLVINIEDPCESCYMTPQQAAVFLLGRRLRYYKLFVVVGTVMKQVHLVHNDVDKIEKELEVALAYPYYNGMVVRVFKGCEHYFDAGAKLTLDHFEDGDTPGWWAKDANGAEWFIGQPGEDFEFVG